MVSDGAENVAFSHLWWYRDAPFDDPLCTHPDSLHGHRKRDLDVPTL